MFVLDLSEAKALARCGLLALAAAVLQPLAFLVSVQGVSLLGLLCMAAQTYCAVHTFVALRELAEQRYGYLRLGRIVLAQIAVIAASLALALLSLFSGMLGQDWLQWTIAAIMALLFAASGVLLILFAVRWRRIADPLLGFHQPILYTLTAFGLTAIATLVYSSPWLYAASQVCGVLAYLLIGHLFLGLSAMPAVSAQPSPAPSPRPVPVQ